MTTFPWLSAELEFTGKLSAEPGSNWSIKAESLLAHNGDKGIVREVMRGSGAAVRLKNTDGADNARCESSSPGVVGWPTGAEFSWSCELYIHELPSTYTTPINIAIINYFSGKLLFTIDGTSNNIFRVWFNSMYHDTIYVPPADRWIKITVVYKGGRLKVFEDGIEKANQAATGNVSAVGPTVIVWGNLSNISIAEEWLSNDGDEAKALSRSAGAFNHNPAGDTDIVYMKPVVSKSGTTVIDDNGQGDMSFVGSPGPTWVPTADDPGPMEGEHPRQGGTGYGTGTGGTEGTTNQALFGYNYNAPMVLMQSIDSALSHGVGLHNGASFGHVRAQGSPVQVPLADNTVANPTGAIIGADMDFDVAASTISFNAGINFRLFFARLVDRPSGSRTSIDITNTAVNDNTYVVTKILSRLGDSAPVVFEVTPAPAGTGSDPGDIVITPTIGTKDDSEDLFIPTANLDDPTADSQSIALAVPDMLQAIHGAGTRDPSTRLKDAVYDTWPETDNIGVSWISGFFIPLGNDRPRKELYLEQLQSLFAYLTEAADGTFTMNQYSVPSRSSSSGDITEDMIQSIELVGQTPEVHSLSVTFMPNRNPQTGLVTGLDSQDIARYSLPFEVTGPRLAKRTNDSVSIQWTSQLVEHDKAEALRDLLWVFFTDRGGRRFFKVTIVGVGSAVTPKLVVGGDTRILHHPRHELRRGLPFFVTRVKSNRIDHKLQIWGYV